MEKDIMDRQAELMREMQEVLIEWTEVANQAIILISEGKHRGAMRMLDTMDDGVLRALEAEYEVLEEMEGEAGKDQNIKKAIVKFAAEEKEAAEAAKGKEKNQACIDPDSYMGKEIKYQTALLHQVLDEIRDMTRKIGKPADQKEEWRYKRDE